jgi:hypothetical protein
MPGARVSENLSSVSVQLEGRLKAAAGRRVLLAVRSTSCSLFPPTEYGPDLLGPRSWSGGRLALMLYLTHRPGRGRGKGQVDPSIRVPFSPLPLDLGNQGRVHSRYQLNQLHVTASADAWVSAVRGAV